MSTWSSRYQLANAPQASAPTTGLTYARTGRARLTCARSVARIVTISYDIIVVRTTYVFFREVPGHARHNDRGTTSRKPEHVQEGNENDSSRRAFLALWARPSCYSTRYQAATTTHERDVHVGVDVHRLETAVHAASPGQAEDPLRPVVRVHSTRIPTNKRLRPPLHSVGSDVRGPRRPECPQVSPRWRAASWPFLAFSLSAACSPSLKLPLS